MGPRDGAVAGGWDALMRRKSAGARFALLVRLWRGIVVVSGGRRCVACGKLACRSACAFSWYVTRVRVV